MSPTENERTNLSDLREFQSKVFAAMHFFCQTAWQHTTKGMQLRYPQYALTESEYDERRMMYGLDLRIKRAFTFEFLISEVLDSLANLRSVYDPAWRNERSVRLTLQYASYAYCLLGGTASAADIEYYLELLELEAASGTRNGASPLEMKCAFRNGHRSMITQFLQGTFIEAMKEVGEMTWSEEGRGVLCYAPSPLYIDRSPEHLKQIVIDHDLVNTGYHLAFSFLRFLEPISGCA